MSRRRIRVRRRATSAMDPQKIARAIRGPGIDTRSWVVTGTVGVSREGEAFDTSDADAVYTDRRGAVVDVRLEPSGAIITARWHGVSVGRFGSVVFPLRGGDEVVVVIPDGDPQSDAITILCAAANATARTPPDWNNDRVLWDLNVPFQIRAPAIALESGNFTINGRRVGYSGGQI